MWELAPHFGAEVIFVEHRYEGKSLPSPAIPNCMSYSSSKQAIEDYARFLEYWLLNSTQNVNATGIIHKRPIIAFGGSYGGMLASWFRMKYPQLVTGAIAASAPIWALPRTNPTGIDGAHQVVKRGLQLPYPPTDKKQQKQKQSNQCVTNLRATWPLLHYLANATSSDPLLTKSKKKKKSDDPPPPPGLAKLTEWFRLCQPLKKINQLIGWASTPWFDMAEGSFPYASSYIPFSLIKSNGTILKLPPWPLQAACWNQSKLHQDWGVTMGGNFNDVLYEITYGNSSLSLQVDWDQAKPNDGVQLDQVLASPQIEGLLTSVRDALAVWYNITHSETCFNLTPAINMRADWRKRGRNVSPVDLFDETTQSEETAFVVDTKVRRLNTKDNHNATALCQEQISQGSWGALCCNEEMNMMIYEAQGMGRDIFWPPNYPRGTKSHADVIEQDYKRYNDTFPGWCLDPMGIYGYSQQPVDPWSTRLDTYYGGKAIEYFSNIVFSNGLMDPWMAGGVHNLSVDALNPTGPHDVPSYDGPTVIPMGPESQDMIALIIEFGGHHTDLMYSSKKDPDCVTKAREVEKKYIAKWISQVADKKN